MKQLVKRKKQQITKPQKKPVQNKSVFVDGRIKGVFAGAANVNLFRTIQGKCHLGREIQEDHQRGCGRRKRNVLRPNPHPPLYHIHKGFLPS